MRWFFVLIAVTSLAFLATIWRELPRWRLGGAQPVSVTSVAWGQDRLPCPKSGSRISIYGDSHVEGRRSAGAGKPFGKVFEEALDHGVHVDLQAVGGDTALMGEARWLHGLDSANIVIIAYGANDAAPRGWLRKKQPVELQSFKASLGNHIEHRQVQRAAIVLMAPPPPGSTALLERMAPYRRVVAEVGRDRKIPVLDPVDAFASCTGIGPLLEYDALHMSAAGHQCLGQWLAEQFCPAVNFGPR